MTLQDIVDQTVKGLGYDLVEIERSAGGLLRITIDHPLVAGETAQWVNVDDCEKVNRQLQFALESAGIVYRPLQLYSPVLARPFRH